MTASKSANGSASLLELSRILTVALAPGGTRNSWCAAAFVPTPSGATASRSPWTTARSMPSLTNGMMLGEPNTRPLSVSFSVTRIGTGCSTYHHQVPSSACSARTVFGSQVCSEGTRSSPAHDQVWRNHKVGNRCSAASSGPRLWAVTRISTSSGPALAYSTTTSK